MPALFEILVTSPELAVRQLAAVELRKKLAKSTKVWMRQSADIREGMKARLLEGIGAEESSLVRSGMARVIAEIARKELPHGAWPALLPWLFQAAEAPNAHQRHTACLLYTSDAADE